MALGLWASGCFSPSFDRCHVSCGTDGTCPPGTRCLGDGYCHGPDDVALCTSPQIDGSVSDGNADGAVADGAPIDGGLPLCEPNDGSSIAPTVAGQLVITEIQKDPVDPEPAGEWFEVYNPSTTQNYDLMGMQVLDAQGTIFNINTSLVIGPGCYLVFAHNGDSGANGGVAPVHFDYPDTWLLGNGAEKVEIFNPIEMVTIDVVDFPPTAPWPDDDMGAAMSLGPGPGDMNLTAVANDDGNNWCDAAAADSYGSGGQGTPGRANPLCP